MLVFASSLTPAAAEAAAHHTGPTEAAAGKTEAAKAAAEKAAVV